MTTKVDTELVVNINKTKKKNPCSLLDIGRKENKNRFAWLEVDVSIKLVITYIYPGSIYGQKFSVL